MHQSKNGTIFYSASDLINYMHCPSITCFDIDILKEDNTAMNRDEYAEILFRKGLEHEQKYFAVLKRCACTVADLSPIPGEPSDAAQTDPYNPIVLLCRLTSGASRTITGTGLYQIRSCQ